MKINKFLEIEVGKSKENETGSPHREKAWSKLPSRGDLLQASLSYQLGNPQVALLHKR